MKISNLLLWLLFAASASAQQPRISDSTRFRYHLIQEQDSNEVREIFRITSDSVITVGDSAKAIRYLGLELLRFAHEREKVRNLIQAYNDFLEVLSAKVPADRKRVEAALNKVYQAQEDYYDRDK